MSVADPYMRALRADCPPLKANVASVALFVGRWDKASAEKVPKHLRNNVGTAIAQEVYKTNCDFISAQRPGSCPFKAAGIDIAALAMQLRDEGGVSFKRIVIR